MFHYKDHFETTLHVTKPFVLQTQMFVRLLWMLGPVVLLPLSGGTDLTWGSVNSSHIMAVKATRTDLLLKRNVKIDVLVSIRYKLDDIKGVVLYMCLA